MLKFLCRILLLYVMADLLPQRVAVLSYRPGQVMGVEQFWYCQIKFATLTCPPILVPVSELVEI
mgnify:CR=1 FL=1